MNIKKRIPDRWNDYSRSGSIIDGTKIICFKVPLNHSPSGIKRWNVKEVLKDIPELGAVIDLTNTDRYYNPQEFRDAGVQHIKIKMEGRLIPPKRQVDKFIETVQELLNKNVELIGVHCTHGLNRTGYMVCRYMRDILQMPAKDAITKFESARGHTMERANYLADLLGKTQIPPPDLEKNNHLKNQVSNQLTNTERPVKKQENWRDHQRTNDERQSNFKHFNNYNSETRNNKGRNIRSRRERWEENKEKEHKFDHKYDY